MFNYFLDQSIKNKYINKINKINKPFFASIFYLLFLINLILSLYNSVDRYRNEILK